MQLTHHVEVVGDIISFNALGVDDGEMLSPNDIVYLFEKQVAFKKWFQVLFQVLFLSAIDPNSSGRR